MNRKKTSGDDLLEFTTPAQAFKDAKRKSSLGLNGGLSPNGLSPANTGNRLSMGHSRTSSFNALNGGSDPALNNGSYHQPQQLQLQQQYPGQQHAQQQARRNPREAYKAQLRPIFDKCDLDRSGRLTEDELRHALFNYDFTEFNISTVRQMIKSFDYTHQSSVDFDQFVALWDYLSRWKAVFEKFDVDKSYSISFNEYENALKALGFTIENVCLQHIFSKFSYRVPGQENVMKLDSFVESMVWIMQITEDFKRFPSNDNGHTATIPFSGFLDVLLRHRD